MLVRSIKYRFRDNAGKLVLNLNSYSEHELGLETLITEPESCGPLIAKHFHQKHIPEKPKSKRNRGHNRTALRI